jgi:hypothetical protein
MSKDRVTSESVTEQNRNRQRSQSGKVPLHHFAKKGPVRSPSKENAPDNAGARNLDPSSGPDEDTLGENFRFDTYLQKRWDAAAREGIKFRETGVTFKVAFIFTFL